MGNLIENYMKINDITERKNMLSNLRINSKRRIGAQIALKIHDYLFGENNNESGSDEEKKFGLGIMTVMEFSPAVITMEATESRLP